MVLHSPRSLTMHLVRLLTSVCNSGCDPCPGIAPKLQPSLWRYFLDAKIRIDIDRASGHPSSPSSGLVMKWAWPDFFFFFFLRGGVCVRELCIFRANVWGSPTAWVTQPLRPGSEGQTVPKFVRKLRRPLQLFDFLLTHSSHHLNKRHPAVNSRMQKRKNGASSLWEAQ